MKKYIITNLMEASLLFNNIESAQDFANKHNNFKVVEVIYNDDNNLKLIGYGITNENRLLGTKDFTWV